MAIPRPCRPKSTAWTTENASLKNSLEAARANMDAGPTLGSKGIAGGDVEGFTRTAEGGLALPDDFASSPGFQISMRKARRPLVVSPSA